MTVNKEKYFPSLKDLLDYYRVENIFQNYRLSNIIIPQQNSNINTVISSVFINKFSEEIAKCSESVLEDLAAALDLTESFQGFRCSFKGSNMTKWELGKWIIETWAEVNEDDAGAELFEKSISGLKELQKIWRKLEPFFSPF